MTDIEIHRCLSRHVARAEWESARDTLPSITPRRLSRWPDCLRIWCVFADQLADNTFTQESHLWDAKEASTCECANARHFNGSLSTIPVQIFAYFAGKPERTAPRYVSLLPVSTLTTFKYKVPSPFLYVRYAQTVCILLVTANKKRIVLNDKYHVVMILNRHPRNAPNASGDRGRFISQHLIYLNPFANQRSPTMSHIFHSYRVKCPNYAHLRGKP